MVTDQRRGYRSPLQLTVPIRDRGAAMLCAVAGVLLAIAACSMPHIDAAQDAPADTPASGGADDSGRQRGRGRRRRALHGEPGVASGAPVTVAYQTGDGSAKAGADYEAASGRLTFAAESTVEQQIEVRLRASLEVTGGGTMYPPFDADILHYALTCSGSSTLGVAAQTERAGAQLTLLRADAADNEASTTGTLNASVTVGLTGATDLELLPRPIGDGSLREVPGTVLCAEHIQCRDRRLPIYCRIIGIGELIEQRLDSSRNEEEEHPCRFTFLVAKPMLGPLGDVHVRPGACHDRLPAFAVEGQRTFQDIERFFFAGLDMKRRSSSRRNDGFYEEILAVRLVTGRKISILVSCPEDHLGGVGGVNHAYGSLHGGNTPCGPSG